MIPYKFAIMQNIDDGFSRRIGELRMQKAQSKNLPSYEERALRDTLTGIMRDAGIEVVDNARYGQRVLDSANDARFQAKKRRYFRTANGEAYGFTVDGKIYVDPRIATSETPIHEYAHLWATAMQQGNPKEWQNIVSLMKDSPMWEQVKSQYPELQTDDEIADEVLAQYSGKRGAEKLRAELDKVAKDNSDMMDKIKAMAAIQNVRDALQKFWKGVADFLHIKYTSAEEVADRVMKDLLKGVNPEYESKDNDILYREGDNLDDIERVNERFNEDLYRLNEGNAQSVILNIGNPGEILRSAGISDMPIRLYGNKLLKKIRKHGFEVSDVKDLPLAINDPIAVFNNYGNERNRAVLTELKTSQGNILATIEWGKGTDAEINIVTSVFGKGKSNIIDWINKGFATYINKAKALDYLRISAPIAEAQDNQELVSATKVVKDFENPPLDGGKIDERSYEDGTLLRPVTDEGILDKLNSGKTIKVYRAMQVINGKLYPPMSAKVDGKLREPININEWEEAEERPELADDKGLFKLNKGNGSSLKAAYNPYIHTSRSPLNDQFSSAQDRDNLVVVEVEIPESELTSGYKAEKAKDPVGELTWHSGPVSSKLKGEKARKVILTRWDKPVRIVPDAEVAKSIAKLLEGENIIMPSNVVTPSLRSELEKLGIPFIETDNRGKPILNREGELASAETTRQRMRDEAVNMSRLLGVEVRIVENGSELAGKRGKAKGFFDRADNSVTIVIGNHKSIGDIQATILHELVGHYGLRNLFGDRFDTMMDDVFRSVDDATRKKIANAAISAYNGDVRVATEEIPIREICSEK